MGAPVAPAPAQEPHVLRTQPQAALTFTHPGLPKGREAHLGIFSQPLDEGLDSLALSRPLPTLPEQQP